MHSLDDLAAPASPPTQTAVIVPVPAAEVVVGEHRRSLDRAAAWGVPAHITVLYPFLPPAGVTESSLADVTAAVASVDAFDCEFPATCWFGSAVLWLAPQPAEPFRRLTRAVWRAFPDHPPYGGAFEESVPHLTVAESAPGGPGALEAAEAAVRPHLPIRQRIDHALLVAGSPQPRSWRTVHRLDLGRG